MMPILQVGPLAIQLPGLLLLAGVWLGLTLAERAAPRRGVDANQLDNLVLVGLIAGLVGARLAYVVRYPTVFLESPISMISLNPSLLDLSSGALIGGLAALIYGQRKHMPFWPTLDALAPGAAVFMLGLGLAHLASGEAFGAPTELPWGIELWGARRHPTQIYEILAAAAILLVMWPGGLLESRLPAAWDRPGVRFLIFVALSAAARLLIEAFRGDSTLLFAGLRSAQVVAWLALAASLWGLGRLRFGGETAIPKEQAAEAKRM